MITMMNAPKSIWPFSTSLGREAKQQSVTHCVKAVREGEGRQKGHQEEGGGSACRGGRGREGEKKENGERVSEGGAQKQEDTHY